MIRQKVRGVVASVAGRHWIVVLAMVKAAAGGMLAVGLPVKLDRLGWSDWRLGLLAAVGAATYAAACAAYGLLLLHRVALGRVMALAAGVCALAALGLWAFKVPLLVFILAAGFSLGSAFFWPSLMAWIGESEESHLVGDISAFNCAWTVSSTVGFVAGGILEVASGGLSLVLVAVVLGLLMAAVPFAHIRGRGAFPATVASPPATPVLPRRFLAAGWLAALLATLAVAAPRAVFVKLNSDLGYTPRDFGIFLGIQGAAQAFVFLALGVLQGWRYRRWPLVAAPVLSAAGSALLFMPFTGGPFAWHVLALGFALLGAGLGLGYAAGFYYTVAGGGRRGRRVGLFEALVSAHQAAGGALGGLAASVSPLWPRRTPYALIAVIAVLGLLVQGVFLRGVGGTREAGAGEGPARGEEGR